MYEHDREELLPTLDCLTRKNFNPPMAGIRVNKMNASSAVIIAAEECTINVPSLDRVKIKEGMVL